MATVTVTLYENHGRITKYSAQSASFIIYEFTDTGRSPIFRRIAVLAQGLYEMNCSGKEPHISPNLSKNEFSDNKPHASPDPREGLAAISSLLIHWTYKHQGHGDTDAHHRAAHTVFRSNVIPLVSKVEEVCAIVCGLKNVEETHHYDWGSYVPPESGNLGVLVDRYIVRLDE
ncbi:MAG: hypothetical protein Q9208_003304 [Pyrenodesmia sp. 3 TL-2023]